LGRERRLQLTKAGRKHLALGRERRVEFAKTSREHLPLGRERRRKLVDSGDEYVMLGLEFFVELADADSRRLPFGSDGSLQRRTVAALLHHHGLKLRDALGRCTPQI